MGYFSKYTLKYPD